MERGRGQGWLLLQETASIGLKGKKSEVTRPAISLTGPASRLTCRHEVGEVSHGVEIGIGKENAFLQ